MPTLSAVAPGSNPAVADPPTSGAERRRSPGLPMSSFLALLNSPWNRKLAAIRDDAAALLARIEAFVEDVDDAEVDAFFASLDPTGRTRGDSTPFRGTLDDAIRDVAGFQWSLEMFLGILGSAVLTLLPGLDGEDTANG